MQQVSNTRFDRVLYALSIITILMTIPQVASVWMNRSGARRIDHHLGHVSGLRVCVAGARPSPTGSDDLSRLRRLDRSRCGDCRRRDRVPFSMNMYTHRGLDQNDRHAITLTATPRILCGATC